MDSLDLVGLRKTLVKAPELWQFRLQEPDGLCRYANERGIQILNSDAVISLWRTGMLRADIVAAPVPIEASGFVLITESDGELFYCDARHIEPRAQGVGGIFGVSPTLPIDARLLFHPFRLYPLYHVDRVFRGKATSVQYLLHKDGVVRIAKSDVEHLDHWTSTNQFADRFDYWNKVAELAIACDPIGYPDIVNARRIPVNSENVVHSQLKDYHELATEVLGKVGVGVVDKFRSDLCYAAELVDDNKLLHVLLRLMASRERERLRGAVGEAMLFLAMAETIRRAAESILGRHLREEDELGFGQWMDGARKQLYGTTRILDASTEDRRDFLTSMGLDAGVKVRCYVEGDTEIGALTSALGLAPQTEFINVRGNFLEKRGKGLQIVGLSRTIRTLMCLAL